MLVFFIVCIILLVIQKYRGRLKTIAGFSLTFMTKLYEPIEEFCIDIFEFIFVNENLNGSRHLIEASSSKDINIIS